MRRTIVVVAGLALQACSSAPVADPATSTTPNPITSEAAPSETTPASIAAGIEASIDPGAGALTGTTDATPLPSPEGSISDPPAPGRYRYRQDGFQTFGALRFNFDPEGTFDVDASQADDRGDRQRTVRRYAESRERETTTLFRQDAILLEEAVERIGSGATRQTFTCRTPDPVPILPIPWRVGATWQGGGACDGLELTYEATLRSVEKRTIAGTTIRTLVIDATYSIEGRDLEQDTEATIWFAPDHRLVARQVERSTGSFQGTPFTRELTEELVSLNPMSG